MVPQQPELALYNARPKTIARIQDTHTHTKSGEYYEALFILLRPCVCVCWERRLIASKLLLLAEEAFIPFVLALSLPLADTLWV